MKTGRQTHTHKIRVKDRETEKGDGDLNTEANVAPCEGSMLTKWWLLCETETKDCLEKRTEKVKVGKWMPIWVLVGEKTDHL